MISDEDFRKVVTRSNLAPSVHNVQPTRWLLTDDAIHLYADLSVGLKVGDPDDNDMALSCGAALEATLLALSDIGLNGHVTDFWDDNDTDDRPGLRKVAQISLEPGTPDPLAVQLEHRFTWRGMFDQGSEGEWDRGDVIFVADHETKAWIAARNDWASLEIMKGRPFRQELLSWMRLSEGHPRHAYDGLSREALLMPKRDALMARWALGPLWPILHLFGATRGITAEADKTTSAAVIACFHRPKEESPIATGRAYLRLCLEAASFGLSGWPMAALTDHNKTRFELCDRFEIGTERRLVQVVRFGKASGKRAPTARRPIEEVIL